MGMKNKTLLVLVLFILSNSIKSEELLLSALKKDIEDNVMERVIKYFSKYDKRFQSIDATLKANDDTHQKIGGDIKRLQEKQISLETKADALEKKTSNTSVTEIQKRVIKLEELSKSAALRSCYEYQQRGITKSGIYYIDPDGLNVGDNPFLVRCDFESQTTEISHNRREKRIISHCSADRCYQLRLVYPASIQQIRSLIELSKTCTQEISFECRLITLSSNKNSNGVWLNRNGKEEVYFTGSNHGKHVCSCGTNQSCSNRANGCNCDSKKLEFQQDTGIITNMSALPITGFEYGKFQFSSQYAAITIGSLKCSGSKNIVPKQIYDSCENLKRIGIEKSGNYLLNDGSVSFCNMEKNIWDTGIQTKLGSLLFKDAMFQAIIEGNHHSYLPAGIIKFDRLVFNFKSNFNLSTGTFTAQKQGIYFFQVNGFIYWQTVRARLMVYLNNKPIRDLWNDGAEEYQNGRELTSFWTFEMNKGDTMILFNNYAHSFLVDGNQPFTLIGYIINP